MTETHKSLQYRPDIDGLRAIAVLGVVFYHADFEWASGGFLGVDVFFAISGYLISSIIFKNLKNETFSFKGFYERRVRRIIPALYFMFAIVTPVSAIVLFPDPFVEYGKSLVASLFFVANFLFWKQDAYTAEPTDLKPLMHTWSLSIEEQFYLVYPIILLVIFRRHIGLKSLSWLVSVVLFFSVCLKFTNADIAGSFFNPVSRAWELIAGGAIAHIHHRQKLRFPPVFSIIGLFAILFSFWAFQDTDLHPGWITLIPIIGTLMIIAPQNQESIGARVLSFRPVVTVGLMSYSLYLWHQPFFALFRNATARNPDLIESLVIILASIGLSFVSYKFIENPVRSKKRVSTRAVWVGFASSSAVLIIIGLVIAKSDGMTWRNPSFFNIQKSDGVYDSGGRPCRNRLPKDSCVFGSFDVPPLIVVGDSHARMLTAPAKEFAAKSDMTFVEMTKSSCPFIKGVEVVENGNETTDCTLKYNDDRSSYIHSFRPGVVIWHARLPSYFRGKPFDNGLGGVESGQSLSFRSEKTSKTQPDHELILEAMQGTIQELRSWGHTVVLVYPVPEMGWEVPEKVRALHFENMANDQDFDLSIPYTTFTESSQMSYFVLDEISDVVRVYPEKLLCNSFVANKCVAYYEGEIYYSDSHHLTDSAALQLFEQIKTALPK